MSIIEQNNNRNLVKLFVAATLLLVLIRGVLGLGAQTNAVVPATNAVIVTNAVKPAVTNVIVTNAAVLTTTNVTTNVTAIVTTNIATSTTLTGTNALTALNATVTDPNSNWAYAIALITPIIIAGVAKTLPRLPKFFLPLATPAVGLLLGLLINWLAKANMPFIDMAKAGALAVFVRETVNQGAKHLTATDPAADAPDRPS